MVSPSKTKHSRVAANQQQKTANASKVKLVKGPTPLVHHRFYLDIQKHQLASKIEYTIKELGGHIEFFLSKDITHFITDKDYSHYQRTGTGTAQLDPEGGPSNSYQNPVTPTTPLTPKTPLSTNRHHYLQYVNEASPSSPSPCVSSHLQQQQQQGTGPGSVGPASASGTTFGGSESRPAKPAAPRSRADAMLQRVRQQQQLQQSPGGSSSYNPLLATQRNASRPCSPLSPSPVPSPTPAVAASGSTTATVRLDRNSQSPAQLAKSWGKPIWSTEYASKFLAKVIGSCKQENQQQRQQQQNLNFAKGSSKGSEGKTTPQHLRGDYIKIESHQRHHYRPAFALFKAWPSLNFAAKSNHSPFDSNRGKGADQRSVQPGVPPAQTQAVQEDRPSVVKTTGTTNQTTTNATAKQENTQQQQQQQCGYCEICRIEYDVLANHLNADEHRAFVRNDGNFAQLDQLIVDGGVDLGAFLKSVEQEELTIVEEPGENCDRIRDTVAVAEAAEGDEECEKEEEVVKVKKRKVEKEETLVDEEETVKKASKEVLEEEARDKLDGRVLELRITPVTIPLKTYSRKSKEVPPSSLTSPSTAAIKRTYAGRKSARVVSVTAPAPAEIPAAPTVDHETPGIAPADSSQMFGRRSAIHHHPHNTLSHHNHQKAKAARQQQQQQQAAALEQQLKEQEPEQVTEETIVVPEDEQVVMKLHGTNESTTTTTTKQNNSKMGMKQSSVVKTPSAAAAAELTLECDGLDPKNTKRISLGLRQNPKRANLNEDFTSLLDETLEPIRKPARIRRESVRRVNYSEPREDEIASQEELIESILLESTAQEAAVTAAEESCRGKKKAAAGSPKRSGSDVKIRGIRWRAPSPQSRPPVKSPLLYKVIEEPKAKSKKNNSTSPTKEASGTPGSPTKASKNGLIVKIRRVRQSELSLLNDEAENFMFPKKDDSSDEDTDEDRQTSSEANPGDYSQEVPSSDYDHQPSSAKRKSAGTPGPTSHPNKKRPVGRPPASAAKESTPAAAATPDATSDNSTPRSRRAGVRGVAALLHDNAEYYKFPDPGSRLRFPEAPIQPGSNPEVNDDDDSEVQAALMPAPKRRGRKPAKSPAATVTAASTALSPEQRQQQDLLLATRGASGCSSPYQHQEQLSSCGKVIADYSKKGSTSGSSKEDGMGAAMFKWSTFVRNCAQIEPYRFAFERVPSLEPWYETFQRQDEASEKMYEYFGNTAYRKLPYEMGGLPPLRQNCCILNYRMKSKTPESTVPSSSNSSTCDGVTTGTKDQPASKASASSSEPLSLPLKKRKLLVDSDRPRKSPREHASTLAILSLLQQQTQHNRRRTISGGSSAVPPLNLPPPSPVPSVGYSPKKEAIKQQQQQEADSALGDEIRSSCGSDPVTEKDEPVGGIGAKKIKFDPPIMPEPSFVNYKVMCQQLEEFLDADGSSSLPEDALPDLPETVPAVPIVAPEPLKQNLVNIVKACDREPPLSLKLVSRHESIVRKIVQYDRRPRPLSAITIKSFDGGGGGVGGGGGGSSGGLPSILGTPGGTCLGIFRKRINRTGWPNVKKRIVTRKQHQQKTTTTKRDSAESAGSAAGEVKKEQPEPEDTSRKSSTEESQVSGETDGAVGDAAAAGGEEEEEAVKQEVEEGVGEEEEEDDDEDEFEDTMTMLDPEEEVGAAAARANGETKKEVTGTGKGVASKAEQLLTDDEEDGAVEEREEQKREEKVKKEMEESRQTPEPTKTEEILIPSRPCPRSSALPSSKYVTKTTTTMTRIDYNVPSSNAAAASGESQKAPAPMEVVSTAAAATTTAAATAEECDSISSRSIFVSDDCDTTSSTLINMCPEADPLALPCTPPVDAVENDGDSRSVTPVVTMAPTTTTTTTPARSRQNSARHVGTGRKRGNLQPIVCLQKINCGTTPGTAASSMRTRSSSRTPIKKTYKRSVFTSALVNSAGKPLKRKRKRKKLKLMNGESAGTSSPSCSEGHNSSSVADEPPTNEDEDDQDESGTDGTDSPTVRRGATTATTTASKNRVTTPVKFSPRKLRKPRGRWYRER